VGRRERLTSKFVNGIRSVEVAGGLYVATGAGGDEAGEAFRPEDGRIQRRCAGLCHSLAHYANLADFLNRVWPACEAVADLRRMDVVLIDGFVTGAIEHGRCGSSGKGRGEQDIAI
jgi:hypothetical protein